MIDDNGWMMIGGLWRKETRKGVAYLGGQITVATVVINVSAFEPRASVSSNPPAYVLKAPAAQLQELADLIDEWRAARTEQHPF